MANRPRIFEFELHMMLGILCMLAGVLVQLFGLLGCWFLILLIFELRKVPSSKTAKCSAPRHPNCSSVVAMLTLHRYDERISVPGCCDDVFPLVLTCFLKLIYPLGGAFRVSLIESPIFVPGAKNFGQGSSVVPFSFLDGCRSSPKL